MAIPIMPLPYSIDALEPVISTQALRIHYEEHYIGYVKKLNRLVQDTEYENLELKDIVLKTGRRSPQDWEIEIFNNANQAWNHEFFWSSLTDDPYPESSIWLRKKMSAGFGSISNFKEEFSKQANEIFGSGWVWLVINKHLELEIVTSKNAQNPLAFGSIPIFVVDVWEHAYYLDYQSDRQSYIQKIWSLANWSFMEKEMQKAEKLQTNRRPYRDFFVRPEWSRLSPSITLRRKSSIQGGTIIGSTIGLVVFFFLSVLVNLKIIPLPGLVNAAGNDSSGWIILVGGLFGIIFGAACGALVGIGTPAPLDEKTNANSLQSSRNLFQTRDN